MTSQPVNWTVDSSHLEGNIQEKENDEDLWPESKTPVNCDGSVAESGTDFLQFICHCGNESSHKDVIKSYSARSKSAMLHKLLLDREVILCSLQQKCSDLQKECDKLQQENVLLKQQGSSLTNLVTTQSVSCQTCHEDITAAEEKWHQCTVDTLEEGEIIDEEKPLSIADDIREAAEQATWNSGMVYEETSGLYYDYNSGYYYDAERGLYYDGSSGTYYYFDEASNSYNFYSQTDSTGNEDPGHEEAMQQENQVLSDAGRKRKREVQSVIDEDDMSTCYNREPPSVNELESLKLQEVTASRPPCIRVIVTETGIPDLTVGTLFLVTCSGAKLGREAEHVICIPDVNCSKYHADISYNETSRNYSIIDLGSRNGTYVNGNRLSSAKQESEPSILNHGDVIQVSSTKLLCHIHVGLDTCNSCEPGQVQSAVHSQQKAEVKFLTQHQKDQQRFANLKELRKKYGLDKQKYSGSSSKSTNYTDRAAVRRKEKGSENPYAKTEVASVESAIHTTNKGFKMLEKMGWKEGQSLGKTEGGITEPINVCQRSGKEGLGAEIHPHVVVNKSDINKRIVWEKTQERYEKLQQESMKDT